MITDLVSDSPNTESPAAQLEQNKTMILEALESCAKNWSKGENIGFSLLLLSSSIK